MKNLIYAGFFTATLLLISSCSTVDGEREDYFGYNNHPKQEDKEDNYSDDYDWTNPLKSDYQGQDNFTINYDYSNMPPSYVPVVVPWYDDPFRWYHRPFSGIYVRFGYSHYAFYDWYSPFYAHCPVYYDPYIYSGANRWWDWYPHTGGGWTDNDYVEKPKKTYQIRDFGPNRGTYSSDVTPYAGGTSSSSGKSSGRTVSKTSTSEKPNFNTGAESKKTIVYKPKSSGSIGSKPDFVKSKSSRSSSKSSYNKNSTNKSSSKKYSGFGSSSKSSSGSSGSKSSGSSGSSGGGSKSSSSRSSGRSR